MTAFGDLLQSFDLERHGAYLLVIGGVVAALVLVLVIDAVVEWKRNGDRHLQAQLDEALQRPTDAQLDANRAARWQG